MRPIEVEVPSDELATAHTLLPGVEPATLVCEGVELLAAGAIPSGYRRPPPTAASCQRR